MPIGDFSVPRRGDRLVPLGVSGLEQYGGRVAEEWLVRLQDERGLRVYREMADNDATVGSILFSVEMLLRNVDWRVEPFSDDPLHLEQAEFVESLLDDMSITWADFVSEALTMLVYGFAPFEIVYKLREGPQQRDPRRRSKHTDGRYGWRKLAIRSQDTLERWEFDDDGGVRGMVQRPRVGPLIFIPIERLLIFRTTSRKGNPQGRSALRNAFLAWHRKKRIEESEAIGIERDLAGLPVFYVPPELFAPDAPSELRAQLQAYRTAVENIKKDEQGGLVLPSIYDETGNRLVEFSLIASSGSRLINTNEVVQRYDRAIAQTILADFVLLGHEKVGSFALSSDKTALFSTALGAWLKEIASVLNRHALPRLYELNGWDSSECAELTHGDIEQPDVERFAAAIANLTTSGWIAPGGLEDENHVRTMLGMPEATEYNVAAQTLGALPTEEETPDEVTDPAAQAGRDGPEDQTDPEDPGTTRDDDRRGANGPAPATNEETEEDAD